MDEKMWKRAGSLLAKIGREREFLEKMVWDMIFYQRGNAKAPGCVYGLALYEATTGIENALHAYSRNEVENTVIALSDAALYVIGVLTIDEMVGLLKEEDAKKLREIAKEIDEVTNILRTYASGAARGDSHSEAADHSKTVDAAEA